MSTELLDDVALRATARACTVLDMSVTKEFSPLICDGCNLECQTTKYVPLHVKTIILHADSSYCDWN